MPDTCDLDDTLLRRAQDLARDGRAMVGLTGAPGAGKSTVSAWLVDRLGPEAVVLPMDGFHLHDDELARLGRSERKGAPDTFDVEGYVALLARVREGGDTTVYAPEFDRSREQSIGGAIAVRPEHRLVVTEGNYLLVETGGWGGVRRLLDEVWYVEPEESLRLERLVARHAAHGKSAAEAERWATVSDQANADLVIATRERADLVVRVP